MLDSTLVQYVSTTKREYFKKIKIYVTIKSDSFHFNTDKHLIFIAMSASVALPLFIECEVLSTVFTIVWLRSCMSTVVLS